MHAETLAGQELLDSAKRKGIVPPDAVWSVAERPSWVILALSFVGAQFAIWPFLGFLAMFVKDFSLLEPPASLVLSVMALSGGVWALRQRGIGLFVAQLAFTALLIGLALWGATLHQWHLGRWLWPVLGLSLLAVAFFVDTDWVQAILGAVAVPLLLRMPWGYWGDGGFGSTWPGLSQTVNIWMLSLVWAFWCLRENQRGHAQWLRTVHAIMGGAGVGLLLELLAMAGSFFSMRMMWGGGRAGSADDPQAWLGRLFHLNGWTLASCALVLLAAWLLLRHWQWLGAGGRRAAVRLPAPALGLWALLYAVWAVLALVVKDLGVLALLFSVVLATGRRRSMALAVLVLLAQLSGFYYALQWPLERKAALLAGLGAFMMLALGALHALGARGHQSGKSAILSSRQPRWVLAQRVALAFGALLVLGLTQRDVTQKEAVVAQGQRIYIALQPRDPRSIMQGDYMALNFALPANMDAAGGNFTDMPQPLFGKVHAVARLDARGVAVLQRIAAKDEILADDELLVPLKYLKGEWTVVTDAYFFPEGQGRVFNAARFGEFRALGQGKVLLVGLADEKLQRIEPRPDTWKQQGGEPLEDRPSPQAGQ
jgi:uncharacterized membrane-anchored protein